MIKKDAAEKIDK